MAAILAGVAWLASAGLTAYLAWQQWTLSETYKAAGLTTGDLGTAAGWNAISAAVTLYFGARLVTGATRSVLLWSTFWGVLTVVFAVVQIGTGVGSDIFVLAAIAAGAAGVLSFVARQGAAVGPETTSVERGERTSPVLILAVVLTGALAVGVVGYAVMNGLGRTGNQTVVTTNVPPTGSIWFGQSYDPATFALTAQSTSTPPSRQVALVASLSRSTRAEYLAVNLADSTTTLPIGGGQMTAGNNVMAYLIAPAFVFEGTYDVTITDTGGNVLARGSLHVQ